jgi:hypothetical protein
MNIWYRDLIGISLGLFGVYSNRSAWSHPAGFWKTSVFFISACCVMINSIALASFIASS